MTQAPNNLSWPAYQYHRSVRAAPIYGIDEVNGNLVVLVKPFTDHRIEIFRPTEPIMAARAEPGDYAVIYADGYRSILLKTVFEEHFARIEAPPAADAAEG